MPRLALKLKECCEVIQYICGSHEIHFISINFLIVPFDLFTHFIYYLYVFLDSSREELNQTCGDVW